MSKLKELFLSKEEKAKQKKKKDLMADAGGGAGGGGAGAGGGAGSGAGAGSGGGAGPGDGSGAGAFGNSSGGGGSAGGDSITATTTSAPSNFFIGSGKPSKRKKKKKGFKFGDGIYESLLEQRIVSDKQFSRADLPQIKIKHITGSPFDYNYKEMSLDSIKPVQKERVKGLVKKSEETFLNNSYNPLILDKDHYIVNGHHRYDAAKNLSIETVNTIIVDASIEELIEHFSAYVDDETVAEATGRSGTGKPDNWPYPQKFNINNRTINFEDIIMMLVEPASQPFFLSGLHFKDPQWQNTSTFKQYCVGRLGIANQMKKMGYKLNGLSVDQEYQDKWKDFQKPQSQPVQGNLFGEPDVPKSNQEPVNDWRATFYEMDHRISGITHSLNIIQVSANYLDRHNERRMQLKSDNEIDGDEYKNLQQNFIEQLDIIRKKIKDLMEGLIIVKNLMIKRIDFPETTRESLETDVYFKKLLNSKLDNKFNKYQ